MISRSNSPTITAMTPRHQAGSLFSHARVNLQHDTTERVKMPASLSPCINGWVCLWRHRLRQRKLPVLPNTALMLQEHNPRRPPLERYDSSCPPCLDVGSSLNTNSNN